MLRARAGEEVVDADDAGAARQQALAQVRAEESGAARDQHAFFEVHPRSFPKPTAPAVVAVRSYRAAPLLSQFNPAAYWPMKPN